MAMKPKEISFSDIVGIIMDCCPRVWRTRTGAVRGTVEDSSDLSGLRIFRLLRSGMNSERSFKRGIT